MWRVFWRRAKGKNGNNENQVANKIIGRALLMWQLFTGTVRPIREDGGGMTSSHDLFVLIDRDNIFCKTFSSEILV